MGHGYLRDFSPYWFKTFPHWNMVTAETYPICQCQCNVLIMQKSILRKKSVTSALIEKCPSLVLHRDTIMLQHRILQFLSIICQVVAYGRLY